ncbi:MAG: flagellar biosynthesis repressor FlbT [Hyphomicrobiaceae bacterium]
MTKSFHISLKAGERIYINGAVLRVDRKVTLEFLNEVTFLLESHVLQPEQATTPLKQMYYLVQTMLVEPANAALAREMFDRSISQLINFFKRSEVREGLQSVERLIREDRVFEALKRLRLLFPIEAEVLAGPVATPPAEVQRAREVGVA